MKTKIQILKWMLALVLLMGASGAWAQVPWTGAQTGAQNTCISNQRYAVTASIVPGALYSWQVSPGNDGTEWKINGSGNDITIDWIIPGTYTITVYTYTVLACPGPSQSVVVTVAPSVTIAAYAPLTSTRCQGAGTVTFATTATNNSSAIVYSLDAASITGGNSIDAATGEVTFAAGWSGSTTITATAAGCNGPVTTSHVVTVTITPTTSPIYHN